MSLYEIECDKCGSHNVEQRIKDWKPPKQPVIKMKDVVAGKVPQTPQSVNAVMVYHTYVLVCNNCGYKSEPFTESMSGSRVSSFNGSIADLKAGGFRLGDTVSGEQSTNTKASHD